MRGIGGLWQSADAAFETPAESDIPICPANMTAVLTDRRHAYCNIHLGVWQADGSHLNRRRTSRENESLGSHPNGEGVPLANYKVIA